jgi:DNA-binding response OmpR family regulator
MVRVGDMTINAANFEVSVGGRRVSLRFKEYELLLLMAANPGRVYSREALLNKVWGYDYLGGTRTVDVHIRRLRSKIEDAEHTFIETVWQVGYRFKDIDRA